MELIDKTKLLAEIKRRILEDYNTGDKEKDAVAQGAIASLKYYIEDTIEVKDDVVSNEPIISPELLTASAAYAREQLANPDYPTYNDEYELLCAFEAGAKWQKEKLKDK